MQQTSQDPPTFSIQCPSCSTTLELEGTAEQWSGQEVQCPSCNTSIQFAEKSHEKSPPQLKNGRQTAFCKWCGVEMWTDVQTCPSCHRDCNTGEVRDNTRFLPHALQDPTPHYYRQQQFKHSTFLGTFLTIGGIIVVGFMVFVGWKAAFNKPKTSSSSNQSPQQTAPAQHQQPTIPAQQPIIPESFSVKVTVAVYTSNGTEWPRHSATFELYINGRKVDSRDASSISVDFLNVPVKVGDVLSGRAMWRNGFGAVGRVDESFKNTRTISTADRDGEILLQTYQYEFMSTPEQRGKWR